MTIKGVSLVACSLLVIGFLLGACAPVVATPSTGTTVAGNPTYDESLTPIDGSVIGERRPILGWTVYPNGQTIKSVRMILDGREVQTSRSSRGEGLAFEHRPAVDLMPGSHNLVASIVFEGYQALSLSSSFSIASNPINPFEGKDTIQLSGMELEAANHLNSIRRTLGLSVLSINHSLTTAVQSHSNFLQLNQFIGHCQNKNYPGFIGVTPQDRAVFFGYGGMATEGIDYGTSSPRMSVEGLLDAPYHRLGLVNPNDREVGAGFSLKPYNMVLNTGTPGARNDDQTIRYPYSNQVNVKSSWFVAESPNPLASYHKDHVYVGYPISLSFHDAKTRELRLLSAMLKDSAGREVPHYIVDSSRESELKKHVFLIPQTPLQPGVTYQVKIEAQRLLMDGSIRPVSEAWSFTTRTAIEVDYLGLINLQGIENLELKLKNGDMQDLSYLLIHDGEFIRRYNTTQGFSWLNAKPLDAGTYRLQVSCPSLSSDLIEYQVSIADRAGKRIVTIISETNLGATPAVRAGLLSIGGSDHIELFWRDGKPATVSYALKRGSEVWRSFADDRYYSQRGMTLPDGTYLLEVTQANMPFQQFKLTLFTKDGERQIALSPAN